MSKRQSFLIDLNFSDKIYSDEDIQEIADNIERAILSEINGGVGISPENSDVTTEGFDISQQGIILTSSKVY